MSQIRNEKRDKSEDNCVRDRDGGGRRQDIKKKRKIEVMETMMSLGPSFQTDAFWVQFS